MEPSSATISYRPYAGGKDLQTVIDLVHSELSEPYVVYTYRYFLDQWQATRRRSPKSSTNCPLQAAIVSDCTRDAVRRDRGTWLTAAQAEATPPGGRRGTASPIGVIVCKQSTHKNGANRGYIAMLCVASAFRKRGIGAGVGGRPCARSF